MPEIDSHDVPEMQARVPPHRRRLDALHGVSVETLLGWLASPATAPSPEVREALRNPMVRASLKEIAARRRGQRR